MERDGPPELDRPFPQLRWESAPWMPVNKQNHGFSASPISSHSHTQHNIFSDIVS
ncbi:3-ketoacyl-CoA thiolase B, peroxisomal [Venturia inaequalis]|nr:3-ketoacyl-CoA thiolase B, peroxisomal [Venturia inaequalis]